MTGRSPAGEEHLDDAIFEMRGKRILVLTHNFVRHRGDAAGAFIFLLLTELEEAGVSISVLAPHEPGLRTHECIDGIEVYRFRYAPKGLERLAYGGDMHERVIKNPLNQILFGFFLGSLMLNTIRLALSRRSELIHAHWWVPSGVVALLVLALLGKPYVLTTHGTGVFILEKFRPLKPLARLVFTKAAAVTAVSSSIKSILVRDLKIRPDKIKVFPMPCDLSLFYPEPTSRKKRRTVLSIGRLIERKGYHYLIDAARLMRDRRSQFKLIIIGNGPEESSLKEKIRMLDLAGYVEITPFQPQHELNHFYNMCDVFVLPSITDWKGEQEGLGLVLLEALGCKKPVVGTSCGGIPDVIYHEKTGLLVPERDPEALASAIERLLRDRKLARRLGESGYRYVIENFSPEATARKTLRVYEEALRTRRGA